MKITLTFDIDQSATWFRPHCANARRNRCQEDLNSFPFAEPEETTRMPSYYVDEGNPANWKPKTSPWTKQTTWLWRLFGATHC